MVATATDAEKRSDIAIATNIRASVLGTKYRMRMANEGMSAEVITAVVCAVLRNSASGVMARPISSLPGIADWRSYQRLSCNCGGEGL